MRALIVFLFLLFLVFPLGCESVEKHPEEEITENIAVVVNGMPITEREVEGHIRGITRDRAEEGLSDEEIREVAIEVAIKRVILEECLDEKGIVVTEAEVEEVILSYVADRLDIETKEDYFEFMAMQGLDQREVMEKTKIVIALDRLFEEMAKDIDITDEVAYQHYEQNKEIAEGEGETFPPFEKVKDFLKEELAVLYGTIAALDELDERREKAKVEILK